MPRGEGALGIFHPIGLNDIFECIFKNTWFVQTLESPRIKTMRFSGLESPAKRDRSWKTLEKSWNFKTVVLDKLTSGTSIGN